MRALSPKLILLAAGVVTVLIFFSLAQEMNRRLQIKQEVVRLEESVRDLEKAIGEMENLNHYFSTDAFQERMAREKLGYRAPGEEVVLIAEEMVANAETTVKNVDPPDLPLPVKWWHLFFVAPLEDDVISYILL